MMDVGRVTRKSGRATWPYDGLLEQVVFVVLKSEWETFARAASVSLVIRSFAQLVDAARTNGISPKS